MNAILRYSLISASILSLLMFGPYFLFGARPEWMKLGEIVGYTSMLLCLSATYFAMRAEAQRRGRLGYTRAFAIGAGVSLVAGLLFGLATIGFYSAIGDALPEALLAYYRDQIVHSGADPATIAAQLVQFEAMKPWFFNRPLQGAVMAATVFVLGIGVSVFAAWWVNRRVAIQTVAVR